MDSSKNKSLSYRAEVLITPKWQSIVRWYFPELSTDEAAGAFVSKIVKKFGVDEDESLYSKRFSFLDFYDGQTGLNMIWSRNYQQFLDNLEVNGSLLAGKDDGLEEELEKKLSKNDAEEERFMFLTVSPSGIFTESKPISCIPYNDIINLFVKMQQEDGCAAYHIKKFPKEFQKIFDRDNVSYGPILDVDFKGNEPDMIPQELKSAWCKKVGLEIYRHRVIQHVFETTHYSVAFSLNFFHPDLRFSNEIDSDFFD